jgi:octanoyl-[GcvH]:protein N-octanoyltransferase
MARGRRAPRPRRGYDRWLSDARWLGAIGARRAGGFTLGWVNEDRREPVRLVRHAFPDRAALSTAVSRAILQRVAEGELPATMRVHRPGRVLAFGRQDRAAAGFADAVRAARERNFQPVVRLAGGRAAIYHEGTLAFSLAVPEAYPPLRTHARFAEMAELVAESLRGLGVDAEVGEVPGEYCPGEFSVNAGGRVKLAGLGQRVISGAAHVGGVLVVSDAAAVRDVLVPVYAALGLEWRPETAGSVADELGDSAQISLADVEEALLTAVERRWRLEPAELDPETLALAERLEPEHLPERPAPTVT